MEHSLDSFGRNVRGLRKKRGISQVELAERSGLHRTYISGIERGVRNVSLINIVALASTLDVTASELLRGVRSEGSDVAERKRGRAEGPAGPRRWRKSSRAK